MPQMAPPVVLFGYHSSAFTQKVRMVLKMKRIPYTWVTVPSTMPRPTLTNLFSLTYRKIPVLAIGRDVHCDSSQIIETLEAHPSFQQPNHPTVYPAALDGRPNRGLIRLFASYYTDRPWFRVICGLMPGALWRSHFGTDRAGLIGHTLDAAKLEAKIPRHLAMLETQLSILEMQLRSSTHELPWLFSTQIPSLADISLFFMLSWGRDIARGRLLGDLTAGAVLDLQPELKGMETVLPRFPAVLSWFHKVEGYLANLPDVEEEKIEIGDESSLAKVVEKLRAYKAADQSPLLPTPILWNQQLDSTTGLAIGQRVSIAPDDTGKDDPVFGDLISASAEEVVIRPVDIAGQRPVIENVRVHVPRVGFVVKPLEGTRESEM